MHGVNDVRQTEISTAELLVHEPSSFEVKVAIGVSKRYKPPSTEQILAELIQAGDDTLHSDINL
jgi:hypothetical protein